MWPTDEGATVVDGDAATGNLYVGEPIRVTRWWLRELPERLDGYTLIDVGSGKGRPLFAAALADQGFRRLVGVEYVRELHEAAVANVGRFGDHGSPIELELGDARAYEFPPEPLVVHFANPFGESVMQTVRENLQASYERDPRPVYAIYHEQWDDPNGSRNIDVLAASPMFDQHWTARLSGLANRALLQRYRIDMFATTEALAG
jgi:SAM-dependent methyltransferase